MTDEYVTHFWGDFILKNIKLWHKTRYDAMVCALCGRLHQGASAMPFIGLYGSSDREITEGKRQ